MSEMMIEDEEKHAGYWDDDQRPSPALAAQDEGDEGFLRSPVQSLVEEPVAEAAEQPAHVPDPLQQAPDPGPASLADVISQRKRAAAAARGPEPEALAAKELGKAGSRSALLDKMIGVGDWLGKGVGMVKEANDTAGLYGKDIPDVIEAAGGSDSMMEAYAPFQEQMQRFGEMTDAANQAINPLPKVKLGKIGESDIKLGVGTKEVLGLATGVAKIAQYHKNEGADPLATAGSERAAVDASQMQFRRALEARRGAGRLYEKATGPYGGTDPMSTPDGRVQDLLAREKKRANLIALQKGMRLALSAGELGKAQEKKGVRPLNEYSMEQTAYLNDREFVPQKPLGLTRFGFDKDENEHRWAPTKGLLDDKGGFARASDLAGPAGQSVYERYKEANKDQPLPDGLMPGMREREDLAALPDGYRDDIEGGRSKQKQVAPFRFAKRAGELAEGTLSSDRMVRDGRYGAAYAAKVADAALTTGTKSAASAAQAGLLLGTGGVAAPLIAGAEAGKTLAFHGKEQLGLGLQWSSEKAEGLIDPKGLAKEQDNRDLYNKHFGLDRPEPAVDDAVAEPVAEPAVDEPVAEQAAVAEPAVESQASASSAAPMQMSEVNGQLSIIPEEPEAAESDASGEPEPAAEQAEPEAAEPEARAAAVPLADPTARAQDIRTRGIHWEKQGDRAVVGRRKKTWGRAIKDATWGGVKKVGTGLAQGVAALATLPYHAAKWGWKGLKGIGSLFKRKKKDTSNPARNALKQVQADAAMGDLDRPQFDWSSISQADINKMSKEEQDQIRMQRERYDEVFGAKAHAGAARMGGTRQAAKDALMAKPVVKHAEETAALREQLAPGPNTPRMASGEILELLRGRAREELAAEQEQAAGGGPGGAGPGGGPGDGGPGADPGGGDLLDQIAELEAQEGGNPPAARQGRGELISEEEKYPDGASEVEPAPARPQTVVEEQQQRPRARDSYRARVAEWERRADEAGVPLIVDPNDPHPFVRDNPYPKARRSTIEDVPLMDPDMGSFGPGAAVEEEGAAPGGRRDPAPGAGGPKIEQLIDGQWQHAPEEEKGAAQPSPRQASEVSFAFDDVEERGHLEREQIGQPSQIESQGPMAGPPKPARWVGAEMLDTGAYSERRELRHKKAAEDAALHLPDLRDLALMTNAADPARAARQLPAIMAAVKVAEKAETKDDATTAWREVDRLQRGIVNRRWSQNAASSAAGIAAAGARQVQRDDLLGRAPLIDASTRHEGLDLPEAQVEDRRLAAGGDDQNRLWELNMPGDKFNIAEHGADDPYEAEKRAKQNPNLYLPRIVENEGLEETKEKIEYAFKRRNPKQRQLIQRMDLELRKRHNRNRNIDMKTKRVLDGDPKANGEDDSGPTADAWAHKGPITVDDREVVPEYPGGVLPGERQGEERRMYGRHYLRPFGGDWRDKETQQVVQVAFTIGEKARDVNDPRSRNNANDHLERGVDAIPLDKRVKPPAAGWDQLKKPGLFGLFAGKAARKAYRQQEAAAQATVKDAYTKMGRHQQPPFVADSEFGKKEWGRLEQQRRDRQQFLRNRALGQNDPTFAAMMFGVVQQPARKPDKDRKGK